MPYIKQEDREVLFQQESDGIPMQPQTPGELNYVFTLFAKQYFAQKGRNYQAINDIVGALESCKLEFYRRVAVPYEDIKIKENGDVY